MKQRNPFFLDPNNGNRYNNHCITKLLANYRSHKKLIELPSRLFYNSELYEKGDRAMIDSMLNWERLPTKGFPLIFHGVYGTDKREARSPSFFNPEEVAIVVDYVLDLLNNKQKVTIVETFRITFFGFATVHLLRDHYVWSSHIS